MKKRSLIISLLILLPGFLMFVGASVPGYTLSGHIRDMSSGEELIGANVYIHRLSTGTVSNQYGYYSITLPEGRYVITFSYVGYIPVEKEVEISSGMTLNVELREDATALEEVKVTAEKANSNVTNLETGTIKLPIKDIRRIPAFMGEVDVIKAIQLLPGVQATSEGSSGFSVRGGSSDHNLILLDEATVYNASHMIGFFSVFNNDAVKDVKLYKGDIPASSGGRLSSLLDVRMKDGNMKDYHLTGGIGSISSRLTVEGPILKDRTSFLVAGRRTYADLFLPLAKNEEIRDNKLFFYDLNMKVNHIFNENNRIFASGYFGRDVFENQFAGMNFGNKTFTLRWNHLFSRKLFSNFSLISSYYDYELGAPEGRPESFRWNSNLKDYSFKADFTYYANPVTILKFGTISTLHRFYPGTARGTGEETALTEFILPSASALEHGIYAMGEEKIGYRFSVKYGLRLSVFQNMGNATLYTYGNNYEVADTLTYGSGEIYNTYSRLEPRLGLNYSLGKNSSLKASYARTNQYVQLAQNSTAGTPLDIWFPASPNIKPQRSDQVSAGYFRNFRNNSIETSAEVYYKWMKNTIDFKDHANLILNPQLEGEVRVGEAWSAGLELMVGINGDKLNGWISYTLSRTMREIEGINDGKPYAAPYDKPHDVAVVLNYILNEKFSFGTNWVYSTGLPHTFPVGRYEIMGTILPIYSDRNAYRFDNYHRLDISLTYRPQSKKDRRWQGEWNLSVYNVYNRKNTWAINFIQDDKNPDVAYAEKTYLFSIIPALSYNFTF